MGILWQRGGAGAWRVQGVVAGGLQLEVEVEEVGLQWGLAEVRLGVGLGREAAGLPHRWGPGEGEGGQLGAPHLHRQRGAMRRGECIRVQA